MPTNNRPVLDRRAGAVSLWLLLAGLALYAGSLGHPFHYDDHHSIEQNPSIRSLRNVPRFFADIHTFSGEQRGAMFRPLLLTSYAVNYGLHGYEVRGYRLLGLLLHVACSTLVYLLGRRLAGDGAGLAAAALFLVHPLHTEAVAYISARSDLLVSACCLVALLWSLGASRLSLAAGLAYVAALLSKETGTVVPLLLAAAEWPGAGWRRLAHLWPKYAALAAIAVAYLGLITANRFLPGSMAMAPRSLGAQAWTQLKGFVFYLWTFGMPVRLSVEPQFFVSSPWDPVALTAGALLLSATAAVLLLRQRLVAVGWVWFLLALLPASAMPLNILVSERRAYLASAGLCLAVAWCWRRLADRWRRLGAGLGVCLAVVAAALSLQRQPAWSSERALWEDAVAKGPLMFRPRANLALAYAKEERPDEALAELRQALRLNPQYADAWVELGNLKFGRGSLEEAEAAYQRALACSPALDGAYYNLGNIYLGRGELDRAIGQYREALARNPALAPAHNNLGQALEAGGRLSEALAAYRAALAADPGLAPAWYNLAATAERSGDVPGARAAYQRAAYLLVQDPQFGRDARYQDYERRCRQALERLGPP